MPRERCDSRFLFRRASVAQTILCLGFGSLAFGCNGLIAEPGAGGANGSPSSGGRWDGAEPVPAASANLFECDPQGDLDLVRPGRRLTRDEIGNAITDLFGPEVLDAAVADLAGLAPATVSARRGATSTDLTLEETDRLFTLFERVGRSAVEQGALDAYVDCDESVDALAGACTRELVERLGLRVLRRPLDDAETDEFIAIYSEMAPESASGLVTSMLLSPAFLFQIENGVPNGSEGLVLSQFEIASRMSFAIQDSIPDDALLTLASEGRLTGAAFADEGRTSPHQQPRQSKAESVLSRLACCPHRPSARGQRTSHR